MTLNFKTESNDNPKLMETYQDHAYYQVFCYAVAFENEGKSNEKLLMTIVSGSDSALQSLKATIDIGTYGGIKFGYGEKELNGYKFRSEQSFRTEKGKYEKFAMTLNNSRKALAIVHEDILNNTKYVNVEPLRQMTK